MLCKLISGLFAALFKSRQELILENLALRQQLAVQQRCIKRPKIKNTDRIFWVWLSRIWNDWRSSLIIVKPPTVIGWHKKGFKLYWKRKSRRVGRPNIDWELIKLIRIMQKVPTDLHYFYSRQFENHAFMDPFPSPFNFITIKQP